MADQLEALVSGSISQKTSHATMRHPVETLGFWPETGYDGARNSSRVRVVRRYWHRI
jgi:hypothetical protein